MNREPFLGVASRFLCTQLYYIWFDRVLDGDRWYSGLLQWIADSQYKKGWKPLLFANLLLQINHLIWYALCQKILKCLIAESSSGWVKCERTKSRERLLLMIVFYSGHLQHEGETPDMERKHLNSNKAQRIHTKLTTIISEMCGAANKQSNQACILQYY